MYWLPRNLDSKFLKNWPQYTLGHIITLWPISIIPLHKASTSHGFRGFSFFLVSSEHFPARGFEILPIQYVDI